MSRIRVMHVLNYLGLGGMEYGVIKLANRLPSDEFETMIVVMGGRRPGIETYIDAKVKIVGIERRAGIDLAAVRRLAQVQRTYKPHITHSHNWGGYFYTAAAQYLHRAPRFVHGEHGRDTPEWHMSRAQRLFIAVTKRNVYRFTTVAHHLARDLCDVWRVSPDRVEVIPNGVDLVNYQVEESRDAIRESIGIPPQSTVIGSIATIRPIKDIPTLFDAVARLAKAGRDIVLVVAGSYPNKQEVDQFIVQSNKLCAPARLVYLGVRKDVARLMQSFDVYVNSSVFEGMSNKILEAMASGVPVVGSDVPGNRELLADGRFGNLFHVRQPQKLAERISILLDNAEFREKLIRDQLEHVRTTYASEVMVEKYARFYRTMAEKR
jgi:glycosyltransferase involved in cell wall biosynthesis